MSHKLCSANLRLLNPVAPSSYRPSRGTCITTDCSRPGRTADIPAGPEGERPAPLRAEFAP